MHVFECMHAPTVLGVAFLRGGASFSPYLQHYRLAYVRICTLYCDLYTIVSFRAAVINHYRSVDYVTLAPSHCTSGSTEHYRRTTILVACNVCGVPRIYVLHF